MAQDKRIFTGGIDKDTDSRLLKEGDYRHALNIRNVSSSDGTAGVVENIRGNREVVYNGFLDEEPAQSQVNKIVFYGDEITGQTETVEFTITVPGSYTSTETITWVDSYGVSSIPIAIFTHTFDTTIGGYTFAFGNNEESTSFNYVSGATHLTITGPVGIEFSVSVNDSVNNNINIQSSSTQSVSAPSEYVCIGAYEDSPSNSIYYFIHDKYGNDDCILEYSHMTNKISPVYHDGRHSEKVLKFSDKHLITGVNKIDDLLYWTDDKERPRGINVRLAKANEQNIINAVTFVRYQWIPGYSSQRTKFDGIPSHDFSVGDGVWINQDSPVSVSSVDGYSEILEVGDDYIITDLPYQGDGPPVSGILLNPNPEGAYSPMFSFGEYSDKIKYFDAVKHQPKDKPEVEVKTKASLGKNNIVGDIWQFRYRYHYFDDEYSKYSPISNVTESSLHYSNQSVDFTRYHNVDNSIDIDFDDSTTNVTEIEIIARKGNHGEFFLIGSKPNNNTSYLRLSRNRTVEGLYDVEPSMISFENNGIYTAVDFNETDALNDELPLLAKAQTIMSNNRIAYGNVTHGRSNVELDVSLSPRYNFDAPDLGTESTLTVQFGYFESGTSEDTSYLKAVINVNSLNLDFTRNNSVLIYYKYFFQAEDALGNDLNRKGLVSVNYNVPPSVNSSVELRDALIGYLNSNEIDAFSSWGSINNLIASTDSSQHLVIRTYHSNGWWLYAPPFSNQFFWNSSRIIKSGVDSVASSFKAGASHSFGIIYYDETNRASYVNSSEDCSVYVKSIPERNVQTLAELVSGEGLSYYEASVAMEGDGSANIKWNISHAPPVWATHFQWAYTGNTSVDNFIQMTITDIHGNNGEDERIFFSLNALKGQTWSYNSKNSSLIDYTFATGDRIRLISHITSDGDRSYFDGVYDFEITSYELYSNSDEDPVNADGYFITINNPDIDDASDKAGNNLSLSNLDFDPIMKGALVEIYRPKANQKEDDLQFFEIGDKMGITNPGLENRSHSHTYGAFSGGDVYIKPRMLAFDNAPTFNMIATEDYYLNDFQDTNHYSKGRANVINKLSRERRLGSTVMYSGPYSSVGDVNYLNNFNISSIPYMDYNKGYGSIQRLDSRNDDLILFQENKVSRVLVGKSLITSPDGSEMVALSNQILSTQSAYAGDYGVSTNPESVSQYGDVFYFTDIKRGSILRLSTDGLTVVSNYGLKDYVRDRGSLYIDINELGGTVGSNYRIRGGYNPTYNEYVVSMPSVFSGDGEAWDSMSTNWESLVNNWEALDLTVAVESETFGFGEEANRFSSFYSYSPEFLTKINNQFISFKNGKLYKHDFNSVHCNFYGTQFGTKLDAVFNKEASSLKRFKAMAIEGDTPMDVSISTEINSSNIKAADFKEKEGIQYANIPFGTSATSSGGEIIGIGYVNGTITQAVDAIHINSSDVDFNALNLPKSNRHFPSEVIIGGSYVISAANGSFDWNTVSEETLAGTGSVGDEFTCNAIGPSGGGNTATLKQYLLFTQEGGVEQEVGYVSLVSSYLNCVVRNSLGAPSPDFVDKFAYIKRIDTLEGDSIKGQYMEASLSLDSSPDKLRLFALDTQVSKSELSNK